MTAINNLLVKRLGAVVDINLQVHRSQARTLKLEWGGVFVPNRWTIMEQEIYILLKLIDNQQHTQPNFIKQN